MKNKLTPFVITAVKEDYFDEYTCYPKKSFTANYLILEDESCTPALLVIEKKLFSSDAEALLFFMKECDLNTIKVSGGGEIKFCCKNFQKRIIPKGESQIFGHAYPQTCYNLFKSIWPACHIKPLGKPQQFTKGSKGLHRKIFSLTEVGQLIKS